MEALSRMISAAVGGGLLVGEYNKLRERKIGLCENL
jgi:hypothetical protein